MPSVPNNPLTALSRTAPRWICRLGDDTGGTPSVTQSVAWLRPLFISRSAGWDRPDSAELAYDLGELDERLLDTQTPVGFARQVETVYEPDAEDEDARLLHWGELDAQRMQIGGGEGEQLALSARVAPFHFGAPLYGPQFRDPTTGDPVTQHGPIVFQPLIDGKIENNRSGLFHDTLFYHFWLDPESRRTTTSADAQDGAAREEWTLPLAVETLCWACNPDETYILNPDIDYLEDVFEDGPELKNVVLKTGQYLPQLLDDLLLRHGYGFFLEYRLEYPDADPDDDDASGLPTREVKIKCFKYGEGLEKTVKLQRPGERLETVKSNLQALDLETSLFELANVVTVHGAFIEREGTWELYRGWPEADDAFRPDQLGRSSGTEFADHQNAWRLWVLNEAGDYSELRTVTAPIPAGAFDLSGDLGDGTIPKRRRFLDPLTQFASVLGETGFRRREPLIQWLDPAGTWRPVPGEWNARLLENQCGIYFDSDEPPAELIAQASRIRVTATIQADRRLTHTTTRLSSSPSLREVVLWIDGSDRFFDRQVLTVGTNASVLAGVPTADERDDAAALQTFAESIRDVEDAVVMRAELVLFGINHEYEIGDLVTKVDGRNISLNRKSPDSTTKRYLQIVGIVWDHAAQQTRLQVIPAREQLAGAIQE